MIKFSCADYSFPLLSRMQVLRLLKLLEFESADLGLFERNPRFLPSDLMASPDSFTRAALEDVNSQELQIADVFLQIGLEPADSSANDPNPKVRARSREVFSRAISFCRTIGCTHMTGLPGVHHGDAERDFVLAAEEATWRLQQCRQSGVVYSIEPHIGSICAETASVRRLLAAVPDLTLTLDYGHFICQGEDSAVVHTLLPHATHVHARSAARGQLQTNLPENTIDFEGMISGLAASRYHGYIALEYVWIDWQGCNRSDNLSETILLREQLRDIAEINRKG
jgi:sugar phosphate isomerase/epimerase